MEYPRRTLELLFILAAVSTFNGVYSSSLNVEVYYECLCPDSKHFVTTQLYPAWQKLGHYFNVGLKPFGKASVSQCYVLAHLRLNFIEYPSLDYWQNAFTIYVHPRLPLHKRFIRDGTLSVSMALLSVREMYTKAVFWILKNYTILSDLQL